MSLNLLKIKSEDCEIAIIKVFAVTAALWAFRIYFWSVTLQLSLRHSLFRQSGCSGGRTEPSASETYSESELKG